MPGQVSTSLELEIDRWMPRDSEQDYTVILNGTNTTTGDTNLTDVTADANVTIYNITNTTGFSEPIATVNNSTDSIKSYNQTGVVAVNATYDGNELYVVYTHNWRSRAGSLDPFAPDLTTLSRSATTKLVYSMTL